MHLGFRESDGLRGLALALCAIAGAMTAPASANHTVEMNATRLAGHATHVIIGRVASVECRSVDAPHGIESLVRLEAVSYLKGGAAAAGTEYDLVVPGGTVDDRTLRLCCAPDFELGATYLLFLQDDWRVHPVVGLHQGAFRIERGRVHRASTMLPVVGIDADGRFEIGRTAKPTPRFLPAVAGPRTRVRLHDEPVPTRPMSLAALLNRLGPELAASAVALERPVRPAAPEPMQRAPLVEVKR